MQVKIKWLYVSLHLMMPEASDLFMGLSSVVIVVTRNDYLHRRVYKRPAESHMTFRELNQSAVVYAHTF